PGRHPLLLDRLRADQPRHRPRLRDGRPADPLLMDAVATPVPLRARRVGWRGFLRGHPTITAGAAIMALAVLIALGAPWLGPLDPPPITPHTRRAPPPGPGCVSAR